MIGDSGLLGVVGDPNHILLQSELMNGGNTRGHSLNGTHVYWIPKQGLRNQEKDLGWNPSSASFISQSSQKTELSRLF